MSPSQLLRDAARLDNDGNHCQAAQLRHDAAEALHALLVAAAIETIPVDARVTDHRECGLWVVRVTSHDVLVCGASHYDLATAITRCARALLARDGATGPACEELRREAWS